MTFTFIAYLNVAVLALMLLVLMVGGIIAGVSRWLAEAEEPYAVGFRFEPEPDPDEEPDAPEASR